MSFLQDTTTLSSTDPDSVGKRHTVLATHLALTVLVHPDLGRAGDSFTHPLGAGPLELDRSSPCFGGRALETSAVSRSPVMLSMEGMELVFRAKGGALRARVGGQRLERPVRVGLGRLEQGVLIELGGRVLLWLRSVSRVRSRPRHGLVGVSHGIEAVRRKIGLAARSDTPVLLRGETGTGKELVARAIHAASLRARGPLVTVNMAAIPESLAAAALFGHGVGAFTGASQARSGFFREADGGTLFLDEIGETPPAVQSLLLRALDSGEIQPAGLRSARVDVRVISATDAQLEGPREDGCFKAALYYRLGGLELCLPPLRERRVDIPLLLQHFLVDELTKLGISPSRLDAWLRPKLVLDLMHHTFPGNVRELRSLAARMALDSEGSATAELPRHFKTAQRKAPPADAARTSDEVVCRAMREHAWNVRRAASALGITRNTLVKAIDRIPSLRLARDLSAELIIEALEEHGSVEAAAMALQVSAHGLKVQMRALDL